MKTGLNQGLHTHRHLSADSSFLQTVAITLAQYLSLYMDAKGKTTSQYCSLLVWVIFHVNALQSMLAHCVVLVVCSRRATVKKTNGRVLSWRWRKSQTSNFADCKNMHQHIAHHGSPWLVVQLLAKNHAPYPRASQTSSDPPCGKKCAKLNCAVKPAGLFCSQICLPCFLWTHSTAWWILIDLVQSGCWDTAD